MIDKDSDLIEWNNSENFIPGDFIKYRGKTGIVIEQIYQYIKTDIPGVGWINIIVDGPYTVRGIPKTCKRCKNAYGYSCTPTYCKYSQSSVLTPDYHCDHFEEGCSWTQ